jgi:hypothetical protein
LVRNVTVPVIERAEEIEPTLIVTGTRGQGAP